MHNSISRKRLIIIVFILEPQDVDDIRLMVVSNVILSSLFCKRDKYNWAFHLFKIYQQYEDSLCRKALSKLRNSKIVSVEKDKKSRKIDDHAPPPLSANPYQLSVTFMHKFLTRFQSDLFGNVNRFVDLIKFQDLVEVPFGSDGGAAAVLTSLSALGTIQFKIEIPEQVVVLDPNIENEKFSQMMEKYKDMFNETSNFKMEDVIKGVKKDAKKPKNPGMKIKKTDNEDDDIVFSMEPPEKGTFMALRSASRLALYIMREDPKESLEAQQLQHAQDYFVVSSCKVWMKLLEQLPTQNELIYEPIINGVENDAMDYDLKPIYEFIDEKLVYGAKCQDLINNFKNDLLTKIEILMQRNLIFRVGVLDTRFVSYKNVKPWILRTFDLKRNDRDDADLRISANRFDIKSRDRDNNTAFTSEVRFVILYIRAS